MAQLNHLLAADGQSAPKCLNRSAANRSADCAQSITSSSVCVCMCAQFALRSGCFGGRWGPPKQPSGLTLGCGQLGASERERDVFAGGGEKLATARETQYARAPMNILARLSSAAAAAATATVSSPARPKLRVGDLLSIKFPCRRLVRARKGAPSAHNQCRRRRLLKGKHGLLLLSLSLSVPRSLRLGAELRMRERAKNIAAIGQSLIHGNSLV